MKLRTITREDIPVVMKMIKEAKVNMKNMGIDQWQDGSPSTETLEKYVNAKNGFINEDLNAFGALVEHDPDYKKYLSGNYVVLHTFVVDQSLRGKGVSDEFFDAILKIAIEMKYEIFGVDTHRDNKAMMAFIARHDFTKLGEVFIDGVKPRIAFYKKL